MTSFLFFYLFGKLFILFFAFINFLTIIIYLFFPLPLERFSSLLAILLIGISPASVFADSLTKNEVSSDQTESLPYSNEIISSSMERLKSYSRLLNSEAQGISLIDAINTSIEIHPKLSALRDQITSQLYDFKSQQSLWLPTFQITSTNYSKTFLDTTNYTKEQILDPLTATLTTEGVENRNYSENYSLGSGLSMTWTFLDPSRQPLINSSHSRLRAYQYLYASSARQQVFEVQQYYYQLQSSLELINAYEEIVKINYRQYEKMIERYDNRLIDSGSLNQSKTQLYSLINDLISYYDSYFRYSSDFSASIGYPEGTLFLPNSQLDVQGEWTLSLDDTITKAKESREEIMYHLNLANSNKSFSKYYLSQYLPVFALFGSSTFSRRWGLNAVDTSISDPFSSATESSGASYGISASWKFFDGGSNYFQNKKYQKLEEQSENNAMNSEVSAISEVRSAYTSFLASTSSINVAQEALEAAKKALEVSEVRFNYGVSDITTLVQTTQLYSQAVINNINSRLKYNINLSQLYRYSASDITSIYYDFYK